VQSDFAGVALEASGDPGVIRTLDPQIRNLSYLSKIKRLRQ